MTFHDETFDASNTIGQWRRSSYCANGACVEMADLGDRVLVRDGKIGALSWHLSFTPADWQAFIGDVRAGNLAPARP